jgi:uncharacterized tellurite resistance protein B-like protein
MIRKFLDQAINALKQVDTAENTAESRDDALRMATAVLMLDVARADHVFSDAELTRVLHLVESHFGLSPEDAAELVDEASREAEDLTSAYEFTRMLHQHLDENEKARIVGLLWEIAYADGKLDKYEDSLILKISDLLYVSRGLVMRLKHDAAG